MTSESGNAPAHPGTPASLPFDAAPLRDVSMERPAHGGHFVARIDGRVIFVRHALPGEKVRVRLTEQDDDASFWRGDVVEVLEPSPHRVAHPWPLADSLKSAARGQPPVGGAEFGHIALAEQRRIKGDIFAEQLSRLAGVERRIEVESVPSESPDGLGWRTRTAFAVNASGRLAMHVHRSNDLVAVTSMPLAVEPITALELWKIDFSGMDRVDVAAGS
ncbi:TRAM domain-containing protein, partial [Arthrobacter sp. Br18]|uniref:TRAM domain-containing protein n=1 Tax=Arthrobacter sp. Br18 TaxID=1312954 RepID=UPI000560C9BD